MPITNVSIKRPIATSMAFLIVIVIYFMFKIPKTNKTIDFLAAGLFFGLSMYSYYAVRILIFFVVLILINYFFNSFLHIGQLLFDLSHLSTHFL